MSWVLITFTLSFSFSAIQFTQLNGLSERHERTELQESELGIEQRE
jgi:hypothetical protein